MLYASLPATSLSKQQHFLTLHNNTLKRLVKTGRNPYKNIYSFAWIYVRTYILSFPFQLHYPKFLFLGIDKKKTKKNTA